MEVGFATVDAGGVRRLRESQDIVSLDGLPTDYSALLDGPVSVVLSSRNPNGSSHLLPVWLGRDDRHLYITVGRGQIVDRNLRARPDVSFVLVDPGNPYRWMSVSAHAEAMEDDGCGCDARRRELIARLGPSGPSGSVDGGWAKGTHALFRARPDRLMLLEKARHG